MAALAPLLAAAAVSIILAVLILWRSSRREAAHVEHVEALMRVALDEYVERRRVETERRFREIVAREWPTIWEQDR